jgi:Mg2+/Co2+ transporter CorC
VPATGERVERDGLIFHISESNGRRVIRLVVTGPPKRSSDSSESESSIPVMKPNSSDREVDLR